MRIVIASNIENGIGLQRDFELLRGFLESLGHEVSGQQFDQPVIPGSFDLAIWLETVNEHLVPLAPRVWYFANPEWLKAEYVRPIQRHCELVFAKTRAAEKSLRTKFSNVHYVGFLTADKSDPSITRKPSFLHIGGNSGMRNTNAVLEAWGTYRYWDEAPLPQLTVVSNSKETVAFEDTPGVTFVKRATDEEIKHLQNSHLFHLYPSAYEGFGHALHEAQSVGAILLTTQAEPMSEVKAPFEVKPCGSRQVNFGTLHDVSPQAIREMVPKMLAQPSHELARLQIEARTRFLRDNAEFTELFSAHLKPKTNLVTFKNGSSIRFGEVGASERFIGGPNLAIAEPLRIAMLGNFHPPFSTENDLLWTMRDMGHSVTTFQENEDTTEDILEGCNGVSLLIYVHTHGWTTPGKLSLNELWAALRKSGTKLASFHLDRYWGLNKLDGREDRIGQHPFWNTDFVFTADGGNQEAFKAILGDDRHHWLPPGVVKRDCYWGTPRADLTVAVGFVGAEGYHPEYPFRGQLLEFLRAVYGKQFRVFTGFRGKELNDLYASIKVVVGDSCFGGADNYWSDRVPETLGRKGFLIHPACKGLTIPGLVTFEPGNLQELQDKIDYYLAAENAREQLRDAASQWVENNETYHNRMSALLKVCLG